MSSERHDAYVMREIGLQALSHNRFAALLQWKPSWRRAHKWQVTIIARQMQPPANIPAR